MNKSFGNMNHSHHSMSDLCVVDDLQDYDGELPVVKLRKESVMTDELSIKPGDTIWAWDVSDMGAKQYVVSDVFEDGDFCEILVNHPSKKGLLCQFPKSCCAKDRVSCLVKVMDCYDNQIKENMAQIRELEEIVSKINNLIAETKG